MKRVITALILCSSMISAQAAIIALNSNIDCAQAGACGAGGTGTGTGLMTLDDVTNLLSWNISWSGLSGSELFAHFHGPALPGFTAGVEVTIFASPQGSPAIGSTTISDGQETDLLNGLWYINIHTSPNFGGGEIRGQVNVIPIPAAAYLLASALGLLGWIRRKAT